MPTPGQTAPIEISGSLQVHSASMQQTEGHTVNGFGAEHITALTLTRYNLQNVHFRSP